MAHQETEHNRRDFLKKIAVLSAATSLPLSFFSCSSDEDLDVDYISSMPLPYKIWDEMLMALKTSPDHLQARVEQLIAGKDPEQMFLFVRDELYLIPPTRDSFSHLSTRMHHGIEGVLRSGFATPREKAELLNDMYTKVGIPSKVVTEVFDIDFTPKEVQAILFRPINREFKPKLSKKTINRWIKEMGLDRKPKETLKTVDKDQKDSLALAEQLLKSLPDQDALKTKEFTFNWDKHSTPTVQFEFNGETLYAHLFDPKVPFGQLRENKPSNIRSISAPDYYDQRLDIKITARTADAPSKPIELLSGTWQSKELVGNRLILSFLSGVGFQKSLTTPIGSLRTFTPSLTFQSFHQEISYMQERGVIGNPITLEGDVIDVSQESARVDGVDFLPKSDPDLQKKVATLAVKVDANVFPNAKASIVATDLHGNLVEGLQAGDFKFTENGVPVNAMMHNNERCPKVLILYDSSLSMPKHYYAENMHNFTKNLEKSILELYPSANVLMQATPSELFTYLLKGSSSDADLIIYATDGDNSDRFNPDNEAIYRNGPPAIILDVSENEKKTFHKMAEITNGMVLPAKDQEATIAAVSNSLKQMDIAPYVFSYYSVEPNKLNTLRVSIDHERITETAEYQFTQTDKSKIHGKKLVGIYLEIWQGNFRQTIKRTLAGWDPQLAPNPTYEHVDQVRGLFLGGMLFSMEGQGPTTAQAYSDILKHRLSSAHWGIPYSEGDHKKAVEELDKGRQLYDPTLASMMQPIQAPMTDKTLTYSSGLRMATVKTIIAIDSKELIKGFDYFTTSHYVTVSADPVLAFKTNLQKTAGMALMEQSMFIQSTVSDLKNKTLLDGETAEKEKRLSQDHPHFEFLKRRIGRYSDRILLFDKSFSSLSYWQINRYTGELYGILPDGSGGGVERIRAQLLDIQKTMNAAYIALNIGLAFAPVTMGLPLGIVATYGLTLVKLYAIVSEVIVLMDTTDLDRQVAMALIELACNVLKTITMGVGGTPGALLAIFDAMLGAKGVSIEGWSCPS